MKFNPLINPILKNEFKKKKLNEKLKKEKNYCSN